MSNVIDRNNPPIVNDLGVHNLCAHCKERYRKLEDALVQIAEMTDPENDESYRADDREGCLDTVHAIASGISA